MSELFMKMDSRLTFIGASDVKANETIAFIPSTAHENNVPPQVPSTRHIIASSVRYRAPKINGTTKTVFKIIDKNFSKTEAGISWNAEPARLSVTNP